MKKNLLYLGLIFLVSLFIELFIFNFNFFLLKDSEKGIIVIDEFTENEENNKKIINVFLNSYVSKFVVNYSTEEDVAVGIDYYKKDYYDSYQKVTFNDVLDNQVIKQTANFNAKVKNVIISYDADKQVNINSIEINNKFNFNWMRFLFVFLAISLISFLGYCYYMKLITKKNIHLYFFVVGLISGGCMILLQPSATFYSWDDQIHFTRVFELRGGNLEWNIGEVNMISADSVGRGSINSIDDQIQQTGYLNKSGEMEFSTYGSRFITYDKVAYIPSFIGFYLGKLLNLPFTICFKLGKLFNLVAYLLIMSYAIKISSVAKNLLTVIGLIPINIFLASQYSYDPVVMSGITLGTVILINWFVDKEYKINFKNFLIFLLAMVIGSFSKAVYIPMILLFLLIPEKKFSSKKQCWQLKIGVLFICLLIMVTFVLPAVNNTMSGDSRGGDTSVSRQLHYILKYPLGYLMVLKDTLGTQLLNYFFGTNIVNYSYIGIGANNLYFVYLILIIFVIFTDSDKKQLNLFQRIAFLVMLLGIMILIWTALYLSFTPVGLNTINGVQPRYYLPLLFPLAMCFSSSFIKNNIKENTYNFITLFIPAIVLLASIYELILCTYCI